jgi:hypothetical protein
MPDSILIDGNRGADVNVRIDDLVVATFPSVLFVGTQRFRIFRIKNKVTCLDGDAGRLNRSNIISSGPPVS